MGFWWVMSLTHLLTCTSISILAATTVRRLRLTSGILSVMCRVGSSGVYDNRGNNSDNAQPKKWIARVRVAVK